MLRTAQDAAVGTISLPGGQVILLKVDEQPVPPAPWLMALTMSKDVTLSNIKALFRPNHILFPRHLLKTYMTFPKFIW